MTPRVTDYKMTYWTIRCVFLIACGSCLKLVSKQTGTEHTVIREQNNYFPNDSTVACDHVWPMDHVSNTLQNSANAVDLALLRKLITFWNTLVLLLKQSEGSGQERTIPAVQHAWDTPIWSGTLDFLSNSEVNLHFLLVIISNWVTLLIKRFSNVANTCQWKEVCRSPVLALTVVIIYFGGGWKHNPVTRVDVGDVLGSHESNCPWQWRKPARALPTLSSLSDDRYVLIRPGHPLFLFCFSS